MPHREGLRSSLQAFFFRALDWTGDWINSIMCWESHLLSHFSVILTERRHKHTELALLCCLTAHRGDAPSHIINIKQQRTFIPPVFSEHKMCHMRRTPEGSWRSFMCCWQVRFCCLLFFWSLTTLGMVLSNRGSPLSEFLILTSHSDSWPFTYSWVSVAWEAALVLAAAAEWQRRQRHDRTDPGGIHTVFRRLLHNTVSSLKPFQRSLGVTLELFM